MREIKFRGKALNRNYYVGDWLDGSLLKIAESRYAVMPALSEIKKGQALQDLEVYPDTIGQYLEVRDKNGEEFCEHDIIQNEQGEVGVLFMENGSLWIGSYCNGYTGLKSYTAADGISGDELKKWEVIGNIHDDPNFMGE